MPHKNKRVKFLTPFFDQMWPSSSRNAHNVRNEQRVHFLNDCVISQSLWCSMTAFNWNNNKASPQNEWEKKARGESRTRRINTCIAKRSWSKKQRSLTSTAENAKPIRWLMLVCPRSQQRRMWIGYCGVHEAAAMRTIDWHRNHGKKHIASAFSGLFCQPLSLSHAVRPACVLFTLFCVQFWPFLLSKPMTIMVKSDMLPRKGWTEINEKKEKKKTTEAAAASSFGPNKCLHLHDRTTSQSSNIRR